MLDTLIAIIKLRHYDTGIPVTTQKQRSGNDETNAKYRIGPNQLDSGLMKHMALRDYFLPVFIAMFVNLNPGRVVTSGNNYWTQGLAAV